MSPDRGRKVMSALMLLVVMSPLAGCSKGESVSSTPTTSSTSTTSGQGDCSPEPGAINLRQGTPYAETSSAGERVSMAISSLHEEGSGYVAQLGFAPVLPKQTVRSGDTFDWAGYTYSVVRVCAGLVVLRKSGGPAGTASPGPSS